MPLSAMSDPSITAHSAICPLAGFANFGLPRAITSPETSARRWHRRVFSSTCSHWLSLDFLWSLSARTVRTPPS